MPFDDFAKHQKTVSETVFWGYQKGWSKDLVNPVEFWWIWSPKRKNASQNDKKSIRFFSKSHRAIRHLAKPYKTCRLLSLLGGQKPTIFGLAPLSGGDLFFLLAASYDADYDAKENCFCIIGRPVFPGLFFSLAIYNTFLGGARTGN